MFVRNNLLRSALPNLSERDAQLMTLRYGLDNGQERALQEVGDILKLTRERVRQIEQGVLAGARTYKTGRQKRNERRFAGVDPAYNQGRKRRVVALDIIWLCKRCHSLRHIEIKRGVSLAASQVVGLVAVEATELW